MTAEFVCLRSVHLCDSPLVHTSKRTEKCVWEMSINLMSLDIALRVLLYCRSHSLGRTVKLCVCVVCVSVMYHWPILLTEMNCETVCTWRFDVLSYHWSRDGHAARLIVVSTRHLRSKVLWERRGRKVSNALWFFNNNKCQFSHNCHNRKAFLWKQHSFCTWYVGCVDFQAAMLTTWGF